MYVAVEISIHAPREGGDLLAEDNDLNAEIATEISIHAPREGGDHAPQLPMPQKHGQFQSTPPAGGATPDGKALYGRIRYFNPRPPRGGRLVSSGSAAGVCYFNPRPPRGGRRPRVVSSAAMIYFNPRPPRGGRRWGEAQPLGGDKGISIHAPRVGGDLDNEPSTHSL